MYIYIHIYIYVCIYIYIYIYVYIYIGCMHGRAGMRLTSRRIVSGICISIQPSIYLSELTLIHFEGEVLVDDEEVGSEGLVKG